MGGVRKFKLVDRSVETLRALTETYVVWDSVVAGFGLRVTPSSKKVFFLKYRVEGGGSGRQRKPTIGTFGIWSCEAARKQARLWVSEVQRGGDPARDRASSREAVSVDDLCDRFWNDHVVVHLKPRTQSEVAGLLRRFVRPNLKHFKVRDVSRDDVARLHNKMSSTPYQANRVLSTLSKMFNLAELWGMRPDGSNPCRHIHKFNERPRERFLAREEIAQLVEVLDRYEAKSPHFVGFLRLALLTGMRKSEIVTLKWSYIDFGAKRIDLPDSKTGKRSIPLSANAIEVLKKIPKVDGNPFVIAGRDEGQQSSGIQKFWQRIREEANLGRVRVHDLRHTFASVAAANGISLYFIGHLLGHRQVSTTQRYAHLAQETLQAAADSIGMAFGSGVGGGAGDKAGVLQVSSTVRRVGSSPKRNSVTKGTMA